VRQATADYRTEANPIGNFLAERCDTTDPYASTYAGRLYKEYSAWAQDMGIRPKDRPSAVEFGEGMKARFDAIRDRKGIRYYGVQLADAKATPSAAG